MLPVLFKVTVLAPKSLNGVNHVLNISAAAVSKALHNDSRISEKTKENVRHSLSVKINKYDLNISKLDTVRFFHQFDFNKQLHDNYSYTAYLYKFNKNIS